MFGFTQEEKDKALRRAVYDEELDDVKKYLSRGANPETPYMRDDGTHLSMLGLAVLSAYTEIGLDISRELLAHGARVDGTEENDQTPLHVAASKGRVKYVELFTTHGACIDAVRKADSRTPLRIAVGGEHWDVAEKLLDLGAATHIACVNNTTPLMLAIRKGAPDKLIRRMEKGINMCENVGDCWSALHWAVRENKTYLLLPIPGIELDIKDTNGNTPLHFAIREKKLEDARLLIKAGANILTENAKGSTPLGELLKETNSSFKKAVLDAYLDRNEQGKLSNPAIISAFYTCVGEGMAEQMVRFLNMGVSVDLQDTMGRTPLMIAMGNTDTDQRDVIVSILRRMGADETIKDVRGHTYTDYAAQPKQQPTKKPSAKKAEEKRNEQPGTDEDTEQQNYGSDAGKTKMINPYTLEVSDGNGLKTIFNFWTRQLIIRDPEGHSTPVICNFRDIERAEAVTEAYELLKSKGGNPPAFEDQALIRKPFAVLRR